MLTMLGPRIRVTNLSHEVPGAWARGLPTNGLVCFIQGHCAMRKEVKSGVPQILFFKALSSSCVTLKK